MATRILNISYDETLLHTRQAILEADGYVVTSTLGFDDALHACRTQSFDLVIIGHSIPRTEQRNLIATLRKVCTTPVLALNRPTEDGVPEADYNLDVSTGPSQLITTLRRVLSRKQAA